MILRGLIGLCFIDQRWKVGLKSIFSGEASILLCCLLAPKPGGQQAMLGPGPLCTGIGSFSTKFQALEVPILR